MAKQAAGLRALRAAGTFRQGLPLSLRDSGGGGGVDLRPSSPSGPTDDIGSPCNILKTSDTRRGWWGPHWPAWALELQKVILGWLTHQIPPAPPGPGGSGSCVAGS